MIDLTGNVAVVTGGARGIGAAIARQLADLNASVAIWDVNQDEAQELAKELFSLHGIATLGLHVDVADPGSVAAGLERTNRELGSVAILVNNAGIDRIGKFLDSTEENWAPVISVNLGGTIRCSHAVAPGMVSQGRGAIVNIASDAGRVGSSGEVVYSGTKGGVIAFTKALARELASSGVRVNTVCPGPTDTLLLDQVAEVNQRLYDALARAVPMGRIGVPADIAPAVAFLASESARYITGQTLSVSGGLTMA
jgi:2-hydroxycyclohexanecarboxyl-CoA dehydrogenase